MNKLIKHYVGFFIIISLILWGCCDFVEYNTEITLRDYNLYNGKNASSPWGVDGLYFVNDDYYCVNTKGRTYDEINKTDYHEMCHNLVSEDVSHFCGRYIIK